MYVCILDIEKLMFCRTCIVPQYITLHILPTLYISLVV